MRTKCFMKLLWSGLFGNAETKFTLRIKSNIMGWFVICLLHVLGSFFAVNETPSAPTSIIQSNSGQSSGHWTRPRDGFWKINTDGAWRKEIQRGGVWRSGTVGGHFTTAVAVICISYCNCPIVLEAIAICSGIQLGSELGLFSMIVESDNKALVDMLNVSITLSLEVEVILRDIKCLQCSFQCYDVVYGKRSSNGAAHTEAGKGIWVGLLFPSLVT